MKKCQITNKISMNASKVSFSNKKHKYRKKINFTKKKIFNQKTDCWEAFKITSRGLKTMYKYIMN